MNFDWYIIWHYRGALLAGLLLTSKLTILSIAFGSILGVLLATARSSHITVLRAMAIIYIELFLALPLLVLLVWLYYALPAIGRSLAFNAFTTAVIGLSMNLAPFVAETVRSGIESLPRTYVDSARVLGMSRWQQLKRIVLPLAIRRSLPPLLANYIGTIKLSSLASVLAVPELLHTGQNIISVEFRPFEAYTGVAVCYLVIILPVTFVYRRLETKYRVRA
jgi:polar amino acid transport system permease protein